MREDDRADLVHHLEELRSRIIRSIAYVGVLTMVGWFFYDHAYRLLMLPVTKAATAAGGKIIFANPLEAFWVRVQVSVVLGVLAAGPLVFWEIWSFVAPGLRRSERRALLPLLPISAVLGLAGAALCYAVSFRMFPWVIALAPPGVQPLFRMSETVLLIAKLLLAFAASFQMPIILIFLVKVGIVSPDFLAAKRKEAIIGLVILSAVVTPTGDAITMLMLAAPLYLLYEGTVVVARFIYRRREAAIKESTAPSP